MLRVKSERTGSGLQTIQQEKEKKEATPGDGLEGCKDVTPVSSVSVLLVTEMFL